MPNTEHQILFEILGHSIVSWQVHKLKPTSKPLQTPSSGKWCCVHSLTSWATFYNPIIWTITQRSKASKKKAPNLPAHTLSIHQMSPCARLGIWYWIPAKYIQSQDGLTCSRLKYSIYFTEALWRYASHYVIGTYWKGLNSTKAIWDNHWYYGPVSYLTHLDTDK